MSDELGVSEPAMVAGIAVEPFAPCPHIDQRLPHLEGAARLDYVMNNYVLSPSASLRVWDTSSGGGSSEEPRVRVKRWHGNSRVQKSVVARYARGILKHGIQVAFRGRLWHMCSPIAVGSAVEPDSELVGGGTMVEAAVVAYKMSKDNKHVQWVVEHGIPDTILLKTGTPDDVLRWIKHQANQFHQGSEMTIIELYDECIAVFLGWEMYRNEHGITKNSCPKKGPLRYEKQRETYVITQHSDFFGECKWQQFDNCKVFQAELERFGIYNEYKTTVENKMDFADNRVDNFKIIKENFEIQDFVKTNFEGAMDTRVFGITLLEILKFA
eukprot:9474123-Pyramimonas_sp.AAC.1